MLNTDRDEGEDINEREIFGMREGGRERVKSRDFKTDDNVVAGMAWT
jgi:hypothetical protein